MGPEMRRPLAGLVLATAALLAVGIPAGWSGETLGSVFTLLLVAAAAIGALSAPREHRRR